VRLASWLLGLAVIGAGLSIVVLWLQASICEYNCSDDDARRDLMVFVFVGLLLAFFLVRKKFGDDGDD
jgi:hypothetical protein